MYQKVALYVAFTFLSFHLYSQIVTISPTFATENGQVTITYDATQGSAGLVGESQVYGHFGVITDASSSSTDWRHVIGNWGTPDSRTQMTNIGNNKHQITYDIRTFHNVPSNEKVLRLSMVFRNADGSKEGKTATGGDIFIDLFDGGFQAKWKTPEEDVLILDTSATTSFEVETSENSTIELYIDNNLVKQDTAVKMLTHPVSFSSTGGHIIHYMATNGTDTQRDTIKYLARAGAKIASPPASYEDGVTVLNDSTVYFQLFAPLKDYVYLIGEFNDWTPDVDYEMSRFPSGDRYWVEVTGLNEKQKYAFQYLVDNEHRIADIYSNMILDPWNDKWIEPSVYPNLKAYPEETDQPVSVFEINPDEYAWDAGINYSKPKEKDLVVYELLIRDFTEGHSYKDVKDSIPYLKKLGINAIELMPINEFEGNDSWGYNPSFYFAPDKYYGPSDSLKKLVEECHRNGIAVILDIALNHSFGQNPQVRMWFDAGAGQWGEPTANSPYFFQQARHDFNVGYDYDHSRPATVDFTKRVLNYWVEEYHIDGYRLDLSKGFTTKNTLGNVGAWGAYDQERIDILNAYKNDVQGNHPGTYFILEHFANNDEETELARLGFMLWGNMNHVHSEANMGYASNLEWGSWKRRGWNSAKAVVYMESHDEERQLYKNGQFGNFTSGYSTKDPRTALNRAATTAAFFFGIPGPKMIWQFGEMGYDYSINTCEDLTINNNCRLSRKPIRWDYLEEDNRRRLFDMYAALIHLKTEDPLWETDDFTMSVTDFTKSIQLKSDDSNAVILGNFDIVPKNVAPGFPTTGWWYEYFSGDSLLVLSVNDPVSLQAGELRLYFDHKRSVPNLTAELVESQSTTPHIYPNPFMSQIIVETEAASEIRIFNALGASLEVEVEFGDTSSRVNTESLAPGVYILEVIHSGQSFRHKLLKQ
jgi:1,4-alpha-glucan branching enzyme